MMLFRSSKNASHTSSVKICLAPLSSSPSFSLFVCLHALSFSLSLSLSLSLALSRLLSLGLTLFHALSDSCSLSLSLSLSHTFISKTEPVRVRQPNFSHPYSSPFLTKHYRHRESHIHIRLPRLYKKQINSKNHSFFSPSNPSQEL